MFLGKLKCESNCSGLKVGFVSLFILQGIAIKTGLPFKNIQFGLVSLQFPLSLGVSVNVCHPSQKFGICGELNPHFYQTAFKASAFCHCSLFLFLRTKSSKDVGSRLVIFFTHLVVFGVF